MKICILGNYTFPSHCDVRAHLDADEAFRERQDHPHPWISNLAMGLASLGGNEVHVVMILPRLCRDHLITLEGVHFHLLCNTHKYARLATLFQSNAWKVRSVVRSLAPDVVHGHGRGPQGYWAVTSGFPHVITNHGQIREHYEALHATGWSTRYRFDLWRERRVNRRMRTCIGVSPNCVDDCRRFLPPDRVFLIDNAIHPLFFEERNVETTRNVVFAGNVSPLKNVLTLVQAVELLPEVTLDLVYVVADPAYLQQVRRYVDEHGLMDRVRFVGGLYQRALAERTARSMVMCLPSSYESFGLVLAEAMALGTAVVGAAVGGMTHVVDHGRTGLLVPPRDHEALAAAIGRVMNDDADTRRLVAAGRAEARERWHPAAVARKTMMVYQAAIDRT